MTSPYTIPRALAGRLRIGTCSWKYDSWKGLVYEAGRYYRSHHYLADYARHFTTVEIDQWFWSLFGGSTRLPKPTDVKQYADSVPDDFRFTVKAPNAITLTHSHATGAKGPGALSGKPNPHFLSVDLLNRFLEALGPMHSRLGPIMFQFEYLNKQKMPSLAAFLERLDAFFRQAPKGFQYAVETRNPNYLVNEFTQFLRERKLGFVFLDGYYMPRISEVAGKIDVGTAPFSIVRLHGPDRAQIEERTAGRWNKIVEPKDHGLRATGEIIRRSLQQGGDIYVNVNNHYEGCAPLTIQRLLDVLRASGLA